MSDIVEINRNNLVTQELYKLLIGSIIPRPIAWISSQNVNGTVNLAPFSFFNIVSAEPPLVSVSILRQDGEMKDTARNILKTKQAVVHIVDSDNVELANQTAMSLAADESEASKFDIALEPAYIVDVPRIRNAKIKLEVKLHQHIPIKENERVTADLLLLEVIHLYANKRVSQDGYIFANKLQPLARLAGNDYAALGEITTIERPRR